MIAAVVESGDGGFTAVSPDSAESSSAVALLLLVVGLFPLLELGNGGLRLVTLSLWMRFRLRRYVLSEAHRR